MWVPRMIFTGVLEVISAMRRRLESLGAGMEWDALYGTGRTFVSYISTASVDIRCGLFVQVIIKCFEILFEICKCFTQDNIPRHRCRTAACFPPLSRNFSAHRPHVARHQRWVGCPTLPILRSYLAPSAESAGKICEAASLQTY